MTERHTFEGGCLCGAVRYRATSTPLRGVICHCAKCRRHSGAPMLAFVHFPLDEFAWTKAQPQWYRSSRYAERGFCSNCGSTVAMREEVLDDRVLICVGSLDDAEPVQIDDHVWTSEQISWLRIDDALPRYPQSSAAVPSRALDD